MTRICRLRTGHWLPIRGNIKLQSRYAKTQNGKKAVSEVRYDVEGENLRTKFWTSAKGYHVKESIPELKAEGATNSDLPRYETRPKRMAKMARDYHDSIQYRDLPDEYGRLMATEITLEKCDAHLSES